MEQLIKNNIQLYKLKINYKIVYKYYNKVIKMNYKIIN